jgi:hypothetical protein
MNDVKPSNYPNPIDPHRSEKELAHFHSRYAKGEPDECWIWLGKPISTGYGRIKQRGQTIRAHRLALVLKLGRDLGPGKVPNHMCGNPPCVNPAHLQESTPRENTLHGNSFASENLTKTRCSKGHELTEENCMPSACARGKRHCLICDRDTSREQAATISAARKALGMKQLDYIAAFGRSKFVALDIIATFGESR